MQMTVSATEARIHFGEIMQDAVLRQQPIVVEKAGKPQAVILAYELYQQLAGNEQENWQARLARAQAKLDAYLAGRELSNAVDMLEEGRRARDEELADLR